MSFEDIVYYQQILLALNETDRLIKNIDKLEIRNNELGLII